MKRAADIYRLWPSVMEMARTLNESPGELLRRREAGELPDPRHDQTIIARALHEEVYIRQRHLDEIRRLAGKKVEIRNRKTRIRHFYEEMGGTAVLAEKLGTRPDALRLWCHRAKFPAKNKYDLAMLAKERGVNLDMTLFDDV